MCLSTIFQYMVALQWCKMTSSVSSVMRRWKAVVCYYCMTTKPI